MSGTLYSFFKKLPAGEGAPKPAMKPASSQQEVVRAPLADVLQPPGSQRSQHDKDADMTPADQVRGEWCAVSRSEQLLGVATAIVFRFANNNLLSGLLPLLCTLRPCRCSNAVPYRRTPLASANATSPMPSRRQAPAGRQRRAPPRLHPQIWPNSPMPRLAPMLAPLLTRLQ